MKKLINVLWAIEKDLRVIASNTEAKNKYGDQEIMTLEEYEKRAKRKCGY